MRVLGTAGHVDHGKSTLVEVLTGINPDRLQEEKDRGMTIDLGFAWLRLPDGEMLSVVDVPGHEKFVNNMLAGAGGIDIALLVVAADESVMPQTREHISILELLEIRRCIVAITKADLVDQSWLELVRQDVVELLGDTHVSDSPIYTVSAATGDGIPSLMNGISKVVMGSGAKEDLGRPRLPIDRAFTVSGFGTVATGTLIDGSLELGREVEIFPLGKKARIRGLQTHNENQSMVLPGTRVAVNLSGIDHSEVKRGDVISYPGYIATSEAFDVRLTVLKDSPRPIRHNMFVTLHVGSSETVSRVRLLENDIVSPGEDTWAQIKPNIFLPVLRGDSFVIRSNMVTLGGGKVVDTNAKRHRRWHQPTLDKLTHLEAGDKSDIILALMATSEPTTFQEMSLTYGIVDENLLEELEILVGNEEVVCTIDDLRRGHFFTASGWSLTVDRSRTFISDYHVEFPLRKGVQKEELRNKLALDGISFSACMNRMTIDGVLVEESSVLRMPSFQQTLSFEQEVAVDKYVAALRSDPYSPPTDLVVDSEILNFLSDKGHVIKVNDGVVYSSEVYESMVEWVVSHIQQNGNISVGDVRDKFGTSRKYVLAFMEYLDQQHVTKRSGDVRILR